MIKTIPIKFDNRETRFFTPENILFYAENVRLILPAPPEGVEYTAPVFGLYDATHRLVARSGAFTDEGGEWAATLNLETHALAMAFVPLLSDARLEFYGEVHEADSLSPIGVGVVPVRNNSKAVRKFLMGGIDGDGGDTGGGGEPEPAPDYGVGEVGDGWTRVWEITLADNESLEIRNPENWPDGASHILVIMSGEKPQLDLRWRVVGYPIVPANSIATAFAYKAGGCFFIQLLHRRDILE